MDRTGWRHLKGPTKSRGTSSFIMENIPHNNNNNDDDNNNGPIGIYLTSVASSCEERHAAY